MNTLTLIMMALTLLPIVIGALLGLKRGLNRSVLRLILIVASVLIAFILRESLIEAVMDTQIEGQTLRETIAAQFTGETEGLLKLVMPIVETLIGVIVFLLSFIALKFVSLIVFWILKIVVRPGQHKRRLAGLLVGVASGILVAYFVCVPLNGLVDSMYTLSKMEIPGGETTASTDSRIVGVSAKPDGPNLGDDVSLSSSSSENPFREICETLGIYEYKASPLGGVYDSVSFGVYDALTTVKNEDGKKITLNVQIGAVSSALEMVSVAQEISNIDISADGLTDENVDKLKESLTKIDNIKNKMTPEMRESLMDMLTVATESLFDGEELPIDFSKLDFEKINFTAAGEAIEQALGLQKLLEGEEKPTEEQIKQQVTDLVEKVAESHLVTAIADMGVDLSDSIGESDREEIEAAIAELQEQNKIDDETAEAIKKMLGLVESGSNDDSGKKPSSSDSVSSDKNDDSYNGGKNNSESKSDVQLKVNEDTVNKRYEDENLIKEQETRERIEELENEINDLEVQKDSADAQGKKELEKKIKDKRAEKEQLERSLGIYTGRGDEQEGIGENENIDADGDGIPDSQQ